MIAPLAADPEVPARHADALEAVLLEHPLGGEIVNAHGRLEPVETVFRSGELDHLGDRPLASPRPFRAPSTQ